VALNCFAEAQVEYQTAMQCYGDLNLNYLMPEPQAGMARIHLTQHDVSAAYAAIAPILNGIAQQPLEGVEEPMRVYFTCYQVLMAYDNVEECATTILKEAHTQLQTRAARIHNEQLRERFLTQVAAHRAIVEAWNGTGLR